MNALKKIANQNVKRLMDGRHVLLKPWKGYKVFKQKNGGLIVCLPGWIAKEMKLQAGTIVYFDCNQQEKMVVLESNTILVSTTAPAQP